MKKDQTVKTINAILTEVFKCEEFLIAARFLKEAADREAKEVESGKLSDAIKATLRRRNANILLLKSRSMTPKQTNQLIEVVSRSEFKFSASAQQSLDGITKR